jgi:hypothetical protein
MTQQQRGKHISHLNILKGAFRESATILQLLDDGHDHNGISSAHHQFVQ